MTGSTLKVRGFIHAQIVDPKTGKIHGDTGWVENSLTNAGLTVLADLIAGGANSYIVGSIAAGEQSTAINMTQTDLVSRISDGAASGFTTLSTGTSGTATATFNATLGSGMLTASHAVAALGLYKTNSAGSLVALQTFSSSQWNTNQDFNITYQLKFATAP